MQSDFLPDRSDTDAWDRRQGSSTTHAPHSETFKEYCDKRPREVNF